MLRASLLADARILPQARQGSYFFNRIGQKWSFELQSLLRMNGFARTKHQATRRH
jgi:hypothetical protein